MQMKHLLVALVILLALVGTAAAVDNNTTNNTTSVESVEIRSALMDYSTIPAEYPAIGSGQINATNWAGFYYDLDDGTETEEIRLKQTEVDGLFIEYRTQPKFKAYEYDFTPADLEGSKLGYAIIGFFAEPYVALGNVDVSDAVDGLSSVKANKIAKLVMDSDDKYTLQTGATLELGEGYSLVIDQIDVDGNKAFIRFMKDGRELNSSIVETGAGNNGQWAFDLTVLNERNMQVMRLHVKSVFQGTETSLVEIEGIWLVDYLNALEVKSDVDYGKWEAQSASATELVYEVDGFNLGDDEDLDLGRGIYIRTGDNFTTDGNKMEGMFYLYKNYTEPGTYEIRSSVNQTETLLTNEGVTFTYENFSAFYFDIDTGAETETLVLNKDETAGAAATDANVTYTTEPTAVSYDYTGQADWTTFDVMGLFGEKYVPFNIVSASGLPESVKQDKIAKLVVDSDEKYTLKTGATLELGNGYSIVVDQIDVDGNKAFIRFMKDGREINSSIVETGATESGNWIYRGTLLNERNVQHFRIHVKSVFQGTQDSLVEIEGLWLMDFANARELKTDDKFGLLEYKGSGSFKADGVPINGDEEKLLANNMYLKTSEDNTRFYVYVEQTIGNGSNVTPPTPPENNTSNNTTPPTPPENNTSNNTTPPVTPEQPSIWERYGMWILGAVVLIIIVAAVAYYFLVYKKQP